MKNSYPKLSAVRLKDGRVVHAPERGNVVLANVMTRHDIPVERMLFFALEAGLSGAVISGYDVDGEYFFASSYADARESLWLLEANKKRLLAS